jgi:ABC-type dipeptide/oligopeptide/nickel transport system ATPase component
MALVAATASIYKKMQIDSLAVSGKVHPALEFIAGCSFQSPCPFACQRYMRERLKFIRHENGHMQACHL